MISKKMAGMLNQQINRELYSAYLYLSMSAYAKFIVMNGVANWLSVQFQEEMTHAMKIYHYVQDQGEQVVLKAIEQPTKDFSSVAELFDLALEHEKKVTKMIHDLASAAAKEDDYATATFLQWFVTEQIEEEASASEIIQKLKMVGKSDAALLFLDSKLGERKFSA